MKKRFTILSLAALSVAVAFSSCQKEMEMDLPSDGEGELAETRASSPTHSYSLSQEVYLNPERGFYKQIDYVFYGVPGVQESEIKNFTEGTLIQTNFWLKDFRTNPDEYKEDPEGSYRPISQAALTRIEEVLQAVRKNGKKAIVRFGYSDSEGSWPLDAAPEHICKHIDQLRYIFDKYVDVIYVVQMGFIGAWGEWCYSTYFTKDQYSTPDYTYYDSENKTSYGNGTYYVNDQWGHHTTQVKGFENRFDVIHKLLYSVPTSRQVALRTPFYKRFYLHYNTGTKVSDNIDQWSSLGGFYESGMTTAQKKNVRLAFFNDVYMLDDKDQMNTFNSSIDTKMWTQQSAYLACGGETATINSGMTHYKDYIEYMDDLSKGDVLNNIKGYHMSYLHHHTGSYMFNHWVENDWYDDIKKALGYRLWITQMTLTGNVLPGNTFSVEFYLKNNGAAPVINKRPMKLVLYNADTKEVKVLKDNAGDVRQVAAGAKAMRFQCKNLTMPKGLTGKWYLALWLPDQNIKGGDLQANPAFSIRLYNSSDGNFKWLNAKDKTGKKAGFNAIHAFYFN